MNSSSVATMITIALHRDGSCGAPAHELGHGTALAEIAEHRPGEELRAGMLRAMAEVQAATDQLPPGDPMREVMADTAVRMEAFRNLLESPSGRSGPPRPTTEQLATLEAIATRPGAGDADRLLTLLASNAGKVLTHRQILREVWGPAYVEHEHYARIYMGHLRRKLEADPAQPRFLLTETADGYRLVTG